jgi:hypothetical protein
LFVEVFHKSHALYFSPFRYLSMKTMSVGMGLEIRVHYVNVVIYQIRIVIIIMVTFRVSLYSFGLN